MDSTVSQILGLQEREEDSKLKKEVVVYLTPDLIGEDGAHCGGCIFFKPESSECQLTEPAKCNAEHGVCSLFIGQPGKETLVDKPPFHLVPKKSVGYIEEAPTKCATCEYFGGKEYPGECAKVAGHIDAGGCCNQWEPGDKKE